jgi:hypothetical protein
MIEAMASSSILKEGPIMVIQSSSGQQSIAPAHVWAHLPTDLQVQVVRLLAQLAAHLVLAEEEPIGLGRKEMDDGLSSIHQQDPA